MKHKIYYEGLAGKVDMSSLPFIYQESDLFDYLHEYSITGRSDHKASFLNYVGFTGKEKSLVIGIKHASDYREIMSKLEQAFEMDIVNETWGRIYVNGSYVECMVIGSGEKYWNLFTTINRASLTLLTKTSLWTIEEVHKFAVHNPSSGVRGWSFPSAFPSSFNNDGRALNFFNYNIKPTPARIIIYGPVANPVVTIGGYPYSINAELLRDERFVIDPRNKTIVKITSSGEVINMFNYRDKENSVFQPIPIGDNIVTLSGEFSVEIILLHERMEPLWK